MNERQSKTKVTRENVTRFIICLLIAFLLWFYVMYTENPEYDQKYTDIRVELRGYTPSYEFDIEYPETIDVTFRGTNIDLAQCKSEDIVAVINFPNEFTSGDRSVSVSFEFLNDVTLTPLKEVRTTLSLKDADILTQIFTDVSVNVIGHAGSQIEKYEFTPVSLPKLTVRGRAEDFDWLESHGINAAVSLSADQINEIYEKVETNGIYEFTMTVTLNLPEGMTAFASPESTEIKTTLLVKKTIDADGKANESGNERTEEKPDEANRSQKNERAS